ncbi:hypothetical protein V1277_005564 [Bradyrhizobium sp. AZCC 1588]|uniref:hypothetical protein n=1 Tax=unclassified Bradyrhizobium TaxID=2631580 RepID=UPI002FEF3DEE
MELLASTAISLISPYLVKSAEEFAKAAGKDAYEAAKRLCDRLASWWSSDPVASAAAAAIKEAPERNGKLLGQMLASALEQDKALAEDVRQLLEGFGPTVQIVQKIEFGEGVTGARIGQLISGSFRVEQNIKDGKNITGFSADRVGR